MNKEEINKLLKDNPIKIIKFDDIEVPVEYLKQTTVNINGDDYIRLQQENHQLKNNNKILNEQKENAYKITDDYYKENQRLKIQASSREEVAIDLQQRIDKAIEYIKHSNWLRQDQTYDNSCDMQGWEVKELLEILKGTNQ